MAARPKNSRAIPKKPLKLKQWNQKMARYPVETIISRNTSHSESIPLIPSGHASSHPSWLSLPGSLPIKAMKTQRGHAGTQHLVRPRRSPHPHLRKPEVSARDLYIQYVIYIYLYIYIYIYIIHMCIMLSVMISFDFEAAPGSVSERFGEITTKWRWHASCFLCLPFQLQVRSASWFDMKSGLSVNRIQHIYIFLQHWFWKARTWPVL